MRGPCLRYSKWSRMNSEKSKDPSLTTTSPIAVDFLPLLVSQNIPSAYTSPGISSTFHWCLHNDFVIPVVSQIEFSLKHVQWPFPALWQFDLLLCFLTSKKSVCATQNKVFDAPYWNCSTLDFPQYTVGFLITQSICRIFHILHYSLVPDTYEIWKELRKERIKQRIKKGSTEKNMIDMREVTEAIDPKTMKTPWDYSVLQFCSSKVQYVIHFFSVFRIGDLGYLNTGKYDQSNVFSCGPVKEKNFKISV